MNDHNEQSVGELIKEYFRRSKGEDFFDKVTIIDSWRKIVGEYIAAHTMDLSIDKNILYVCIDSDVLRNELSYSKTVLIRNLNQVVGYDYIKDIVLR